MNTEGIEKLIIKYMTKSISANEIDQLSVWLENPKHSEIFIEYVKVNYVIEYNLSQYNTVKTKETFNETIKDSNFKLFRIKVQSVLKYAAIFSGIIGIAYFSFIQNRISDFQEEQLFSSEKNITLKQENGSLKVLKGNIEEEIVNSRGIVIGVQSGDKINYKNNSKIDKLVYNQLSVPNGKTFQLVLSDGTEVHLNAGTTIKYPIRFIKGEKRQVFLINGEAYFKVTKDADHHFIVSTDEMNIRVIGTEFNVCSYPEDIDVTTVLVEGSVSLFAKEGSNQETAEILEPGYKAAWNKTNKDISFEKVDTSIYTGWTNGKLIFKNAQFKNIIKKLERKYNVSIINNNEKLGEQYYDAIFDIETIEQVLNIFEKSFTMKYTKKNNQIIIN